MFHIGLSEFNFLPLSERKGIPLPKIEFEGFDPSSTYAGYYDLSAKRVVICYGEDIDLAATIAHEYRHYLQDYTGIIKLPETGSVFDSSLEYEQAVRKYFRTQKHELDALLYELKHAKSENSYWWYHHLVKHERLPKNV